MTPIGIGALLAALCIPALAQQPASERSDPPPAAAMPAADMADGEVRKVDRSAGKLTLKHGEIRNLDMPPMTMVFQVADPAMLDGVKPGDKVRFRAEKTGSGYAVTAIEAAR
jgi:Cu(I)/Ag(I) efflux system periplasmic protein CusF